MSYYDNSIDHISSSKHRLLAETTLEKVHLDGNYTD